MKAWWWLLAALQFVLNAESTVPDISQFNDQDDLYNSLQYAFKPAELYKLEKKRVQNEIDKKVPKFHSWGGKRYTRPMFDEGNDGDETTQKISNWVGDNLSLDDNINFRLQGNENSSDTKEKRDPENVNKDVKRIIIKTIEEELDQTDFDRLNVKQSCVNSPDSNINYNKKCTQEITNMKPIFAYSNNPMNREYDYLKDYIDNIRLSEIVNKREDMDFLKIKRNKNRFSNKNPSKKLNYRQNQDVSWHGKRMPAFSSWGGKRSRESFASESKKVPSFSHRSGKRSSFPKQLYMHTLLSGNLRRSNEESEIKDNRFLNIDNGNEESQKYETNKNAESEQYETNITPIDKLSDTEPYTKNEEIEPPSIQSEKRTPFSTWGGKRPAFSSWGGKRDTSFNNWGDKRSLEIVNWGSKRAAAFNSWGGKRTATSSFGGKRPAFSSWGGKRAAISSWTNKRDKLLRMKSKRDLLETCPECYSGREYRSKEYLEHSTHSNESENAVINYWQDLKKVTNEIGETTGETLSLLDNESVNERTIPHIEPWNDLRKTLLTNWNDNISKQTKGIIKQNGNVYEPETITDWNDNISEQTKDIKQNDKVYEPGTKDILTYRNEIEEKVYPQILNIFSKRTQSIHSLEDNLVPGFSKWMITGQMLSNKSQTTSMPTQYDENIQSLENNYEKGTVQMPSRSSKRSPAFNSWGGKRTGEFTNFVDKRGLAFSSWGGKRSERIQDSGGKQIKSFIADSEKWEIDDTEKYYQEPIETISKRAAAFSSWGGKRSPAFNSWGGKRTPAFNSWEDKRATTFNSWGGKRGAEFNSWDEKRSPAFNSWGGKRAVAFNSWGGKRSPAFNSWGGKRDASFNSWGGKRTPSFNSWGGKRTPSFNSWGGKRSPTFNSWGGKREAAFNSWGGKRSPAFNSWGGKRAASLHSWGGKRTPDFNSWGGKGAAAFNSWGGKRSPAFNSWGGKRDAIFNSWDEKRTPAFNSWGGKRSPAFNSWGGKRSPAFNSWGGKRSPAFNSWGDKRSPAFNSWGGKRDATFNSWDEKRTPAFNSWGGKRSPAFNSWGGKRAAAFNSWGDKRPQFFRRNDENDIENATYQTQTPSEEIEDYENLGGNYHQQELSNMNSNGEEIFDNLIGKKPNLFWGNRFTDDIPEINQINNHTNNIHNEYKLFNNNILDKLIAGYHNSIIPYLEKEIGQAEPEESKWKNNIIESMKDNSFNIPKFNVNSYKIDTNWKSLNKRGVNKLNHNQNILSKKTPASNIWGGKRIPAFSSWGGKRSIGFFEQKSKTSDIPGNVVSEPFYNDTVFYNDILKKRIIGNNQPNLFFQIVNLMDFINRERNSEPSQKIGSNESDSLPGHYNDLRVTLMKNYFNMREHQNVHLDKENTIQMPRTNDLSQYKRVPAFYSWGGKRSFEYYQNEIIKDLKKLDQRYEPMNLNNNEINKIFEVSPTYLDDSNDYSPLLQKRTKRSTQEIKDSGLLCNGNDQTKLIESNKETGCPKIIFEDNTDYIKKEANNMNIEDKVTIDKTIDLNNLTENKHANNVGEPKNKYQSNNLKYKENKLLSNKKPATLPIPNLNWSKIRETYLQSFDKNLLQDRDTNLQDQLGSKVNPILRYEEQVKTSNIEMNKKIPSLTLNNQIPTFYTKGSKKSSIFWSWAGKRSSKSNEISLKQNNLTNNDKRSNEHRTHKRDVMNAKFIKPVDNKGNGIFNYLLTPVETKELRKVETKSKIPQKKNDNCDNVLYKMINGMIYSNGMERYPRDSVSNGMYQRMLFKGNGIKEVRWPVMRPNRRGAEFYSWGGKRSPL